MSSGEMCELTAREKKEKGERKKERKILF